MGGNDSKSESTPLTGAQRAEIYDAAIKRIGAGANYLLGEYQPFSLSAGNAKTLTNGDYAKLQADALRGTTAGLDYAKAQDLKNVNNDLAGRGIWSSGLADRAITDKVAAYAPQYERAGADATTLRYNMQNSENQALNQYQLANTSLGNDQMKQIYESRWRPADYLAGLWNGTGGVISSGTSGGWSI